MPRFVVLRHETPPGSSRPLHWDLLLEGPGGCRTWALTREPETGVWIRAESLSDHRPFYLDYEGPVAGDRGSVTRWDRGNYEWRAEGEQELKVWLEGERLRGEVRLVRETDDAQIWLAWFASG